MAETFTFQASTEIRELVKANRLKYFEQQIAESQVNIRIYEANVVVYNQPADITSLANEVTKLSRLTLGYNTVYDLD